MDLIINLSNSKELEKLRENFARQANVTHNVITIPGVVAVRRQDARNCWNLGPANKDIPTELANQDGAAYQTDGIFIENMKGKKGTQEVIKTLSVLAVQVNMTKEMLLNVLRNIEPGEINYAATGAYWDPRDKRNFKINNPDPNGERFEFHCTMK